MRYSWKSYKGKEMINGTFKFEVEGTQEKHLQKALELLLSLTEDTITAYRINPETQEFTLYRYDDEPETVPFWDKTRTETVSHMVWDWLKDARTKTAFGALHPEPDIDGSTELGWKIVAPYHSYKDSYRVIAKISHTWFEYHK